MPLTDEYIQELAQQMLEQLATPIEFNKRVIAAVDDLHTYAVNRDTPTFWKIRGQYFPAMKENFRIIMNSCFSLQPPTPEEFEETTPKLYQAATAIVDLCDATLDRFKKENEIFIKKLNVYLMLVEQSRKADILKLHIEPYLTDYFEFERKFYDTLAEIEKLRNICWNVAKFFNRIDATKNYFRLIYPIANQLAITENNIDKNLKKLKEFILTENVTFIFFPRDKRSTNKFEHTMDQIQDALIELNDNITLISAQLSQCQSRHLSYSLIDLYEFIFEMRLENFTLEDAAGDICQIRENTGRTLNYLSYKNSAKKLQVLPGPSLANNYGLSSEQNGKRKLEEEATGSANPTKKVKLEDNSNSENFAPSNH